MTKEKVLDKLKKVKAMADGAAAIGSEKEAQAFADMLNRLLLDHKLEMTDLEFETMEKEQPIEKHWIHNREHGIKEKRQRIEWQEKLAITIAQAHFCRILVSQGSNRICLVGRHEDVAVAEYLFVTMVRSVETIANRELWKYRYEQIQQTGKRGGSATYGFRASFIQSFIDRLRQRFDELRLQKTSGQEMGLMRINKSEKAVNEFIENLNLKNSRALSRDVQFHREGVRRGRAAADRVSLTANAIGNTKKYPGLPE